MSLLIKLPKIRGKYREQARLAQVTWFGVGGPAEVIFRPEDIDDLSFFLKEISKEIPVSIIGVGSNLLVRDGGIEGVVIRLGRNFAKMSIENSNILRAGAAALNYNVVHFTADNSLSGIEFLVGVPGSIGGALCMNAGCYSREVSDVMIKATVVDSDGNLHVLSKSDIGYVYRGNTLPDDWFFVEGFFQLEFMEKEIVKSNIEDISKKREETQPIRTKTSGSTFKNPGDKKAWQLIDAAGCRGMREGGAIVSTKHCNFLINEGNAAAKDIEKLGEKVRKMVYENTGIMLDWEIKRIGKDSCR